METDMMESKIFPWNTKQYEAFWLNPNGVIIPVSLTHIQTIIDNPVTFGPKREIIEKSFQKYNEPLGLEGKARQEIMLELLKKKMDSGAYFIERICDQISNL